MTQDVRRIRLLRALLGENKDMGDGPIPEDVGTQKRLLRALMNVRPAGPLPPDMEAIQDAYLQEATREKGVVDLADLRPVQDRIYLWQGDITRLAVDGIVNAANSGMTGCWLPNHACIDNAIHTYAGCQLRLICHEMMKVKGIRSRQGKRKSPRLLTFLAVLSFIRWGQLSKDL